VPAVAPAVAAWPLFVREHRRDALLLAGGFAAWFILAASWKAWDGGACYGPRMIVAVIPLALVPIALLPKCGWWQARTARTLAALLLFASVVTNAVAAFAPSYAWRTHAWSLLWRWAVN
ncbi:MAG: hypothetical protein ACREHD_01405, partial [Pirellulales bacterium]